MQAILIPKSYKLYYVDTLNYNPQKIFSDLAKPENKDVFVVCDFWFIYKHRADFYKMETDKDCANAGMIYTWNEPLFKMITDFVWKY